MAENETRLTYRLRRLSVEERDELLARLGLSRNTFYARLRAPRTLTLDEADCIGSFLTELDNEDYDMMEMLRPIQLT